MMRKSIVGLLIFAAVVAAFLLWREPRVYQLEVVTYFRHATGIKSGTEVRIDGVNVGSVRSVHVRPELGDRPIEVHMAIVTSYPINLPSDSIVRIASDGVLGPSLLDIDTRGSQAGPLRNHGALNSIELTDDAAASAVERVGNALVKASKQMRTDSEKTRVNTAPGNAQ